MDEPRVLPYQPFPSFEQFLSHSLDTSTADEFFSSLEEIKASVTADQLRSAIERATKWAAVDTGAIENLYDVDRGFTLTVAKEAAAWENIHAVVGIQAERAINDALTAYEMVLDVATQTQPITEAWIRQLHETICASQDTYAVVTAVGPQEHTLPKGSYKSQPNNPFNMRSGTVHPYASVDDTGPEMHRLVTQLNQDSFLAAHPVLQAAYAHYAFVCIHPFPDGNGRVSRALASIYLYRRPGLPLVIFADQKGDYLDCLEAADDGNYSHFSRFIAERTIDTVQMVSSDMRRKSRRTVSDNLDELRSLMLGRGSVPHDEIDALGSLLFDEFHKSLEQALTDNPVEHPLGLELSLYHSEPSTRINEFRPVPNKRFLQLTAISHAPATASVGAQFSVMIRKGLGSGSDFIIVRSPSEIIEEVSVRDVTPNVGFALTYRLKAAAEDELLHLIEDVVISGDATLKSNGYRD